jgi:protein SCO1/2
MSYALIALINAASCLALSPPETDSAIKIADSAVGKYIGDYTLIDQDGKSFRLKEFAGKPFLLSFIYTNCSLICPTITTQLKDAFTEAGGSFGSKFQALTISFDTVNDTPQSMKLYGGSFTDNFNKWRFAVASKPTIEALAKDVGFYYMIDGKLDHMNLVTVVDKEGRVYRQLYGYTLKPYEILQPVYQALSSKEAAKPKPLTIMERIRLLCTTYDEKTGTYIVDYTFPVVFLLGLTLQLTLALIVAYIFWSRRTKKVTHKYL